MHESFPKEFWILLGGVLLGVLGKSLSLEKVSYKVLASKLATAASATLAMWHFGMFQHWDADQIISYGIFMSWGMVEGASWTLKGVLDLMVKLSKLK